MAHDRVIKVHPFSELAPDDVVALVESALRPESGLAVFAGPVGSGKTTIAMAVANLLGMRGRPIVVLTELPGEVSGLRLAGGVGWTFAGAGTSAAEWKSAFEAVESAGAKVVLVPGFTPENASAVFEAAKRMSIIVCLDSPLVGIDVIYSLTQYGGEQESLLAVLNLIHSQFLIRTLCEQCREPTTLGRKAAQDIAPGINAAMDVWMERGCSACSGTGTKAMTAVYDIIAIDATTRAAVSEAARTYVAPTLPATHYRSMQEVARRMLLQGEVGVGTFRREIGRNPVLRATNQLERERDAARATREMFRRFVDDAVIQSLAADDNELARPRRVDATCLFCDVRGFSAFAERHEPREVFDVLNRIVDEIIALVVRHGGMVDKIIGDSVMALFGLPIAQPDHARRAATCALAIQQRIVRLGEEHREVAGLKVGVGINSGEVAAGCLGNGQRLEYTVLGDVVNIAARLEALAAPGQVLIGRSTRHRLGNAFAVRDAGDQVIRGRTEPVRVFELLASAN